MGLFRSVSDKSPDVCTCRLMDMGTSSRCRRIHCRRGTRRQSCSMVFAAGSRPCVLSMCRRLSRLFVGIHSKPQSQNPAPCPAQAHLDAMAWVKLNVLHWHMTDDQVTTRLRRPWFRRWSPFLRHLARQTLRQRPAVGSRHRSVPESFHILQVRFPPATAEELFTSTSGYCRGGHEKLLVLDYIDFQNRQAAEHWREGAPLSKRPSAPRETCDGCQLDHSG